MTALKNPVGIHERQDVCGSLAKVLNRIERGSLDKFRFVCFFLFYFLGLGGEGFRVSTGNYRRWLTDMPPSLGLI